ncbi:MAG: CoA transferase [Gemmatimonadetes bacterium]|nr:CoA transferase [Gemmatimonadota bacterium]MYE16561.1 CoA transferase [Gemmatimonadota bacterium]MYG24159.1 CoA transferase [Gemmatimonadota bacterium]MYJ40689.1 CoA transferase [Gemmatimonadota bacterium]
MAGPVCGRMLADMGADVVKVEPPGTGDPTRAFAPPRMGESAAAFVMMNRNKRGMVIDLKSKPGRDVARRMLAGCDVVIENFRAGVMDELGLGYESLRAGNAGLIYCQITGYGRTGPLAGHRGFDLIAQGMTGMMSVTGEGEGRPPVKCGPPLTDITAGILGAMGVVTALYARERTGEGQRVDTSLYEAGIVQTFWQSAVALATGESPGPLGSAHPLAAPYEALPTADGWITVGGWNQVNWLRLVKVLGLEALAGDPRFVSNADRMANLDALREVLAQRLRTATTDEWLRLLEAANVPAGPVSSILEMLRHPQTVAREMVVQVPEGDGTAATLGMPVKFSAAPAAVERGAPRMGEHTEQVLGEYGFGEGEIAELLRSGAVGSLKS